MVDLFNALTGLYADREPHLVNDLAKATAKLFERDRFATKVRAPSTPRAARAAVGVSDEPLKRSKRLAVRKLRELLM